MLYKELMSHIHIFTKSSILGIIKFENLKDFGRKRKHKLIIIVQR